MTDFFQNGIITTLHDFETKSTKLIEEELLRFSKEIGEKPLESIKANSMEALIGAIFLDSGFTSTEKIVLDLWEEEIEKIDNYVMDIKNNIKDQKVIWIHVASLGEFEQAKPIIDSLKIKYENKIECVYNDVFIYQKNKKNI